MLPVADRVPDESKPAIRNRFGYFGQLNPYKGADVLLEAMELLGEDFDGHLWVHGANLEFQPVEFRARVQALSDGSRFNITFAGPYERGELGKLTAEIDWVVVPSIWWETGPIVSWRCSSTGGR